MKICTVTILGVSPYSQSRPVEDPKLPGEKADDYESRTWCSRLTLDKDGHVVIPFIAFKKAIDEAAALTPRKIKGNNKQTYTKSMKGGFLITEPLVLPIKGADVVGETFWVSATGDSRGVGSRVKRTFPMIYDWGGTLTCYIGNPIIDKDVFEQYVREAGQFIGIGRFRPERGGVNGRFQVKKFAWKEEA